MDMEPIDGEECNCMETLYIIAVIVVAVIVSIGAWIGDMLKRIDNLVDDDPYSERVK